MTSDFAGNFCGRFAPLATLVVEHTDLDSMVTHFNKTVTDTTAELLGKQRRKRKPFVTPEILDLYDLRRDQYKREASQKEPETVERLKESSRQR